MKTKTKSVPAVQIFEKTIKFKYVTNFKVNSQEEWLIEWVYNMSLLLMWLHGFSTIRWLLRPADLMFYKKTLQEF